MSTTTNPDTSARPAASAGDLESSAGRTSRARWAALGAAVAISVGAGGLMSASAAVGSGERATYVPINPCRVMDTRQAPETKGPRSTPIGVGETHTVTVWGVQGDCNIPTDAVGVVMNVAAVNPTASSYLTVFPAGGASPLAANLNWVAGQPPVSNSVTADLNAEGKLSFYNKFGTVDVAADIVGYYVHHHHDDRYYTKAQVQNLQVYAQVQPQGPALVPARTNGFSGVTRVGTGHYCVTLDAGTAYDVQDVAAVASVEYGNSAPGAASVQVRGASMCPDKSKQFDVYTYDAAGALSDQVAFNLVVPIHVDPMILIPGIELTEIATEI